MIRDTDADSKMDPTFVRLTVAAIWVIFFMLLFFVIMEIKALCDRRKHAKHLKTIELVSNQLNRGSSYPTTAESH